MQFLEQKRCHAEPSSSQASGRGPEPSIEDELLPKEGKKGFFL